MFGRSKKQYRIKIADDVIIAPEETLVDSFSTHATIEQPITRGVFGVTFGFIILAICLIALKTFQLQIMSQGSYLAQIERSTKTSYPLPALRGVISDRNRKIVAENIPVFDVVAVQIGLPKDQAKFDQVLQRLSGIVNLSTDELRSIFEKNKKNATFVISKGLSKDQAVNLRAAPLSGIHVVTNSQRRYPHGTSFAHVLGYTTKVNADDLVKDNYYQLSDRIGRAGLEAYYEEVLRGQHRAFDFETNDILTAEAGNNLQLTIDTEAQVQLHKILINVLAQAGVSRGAAVVQDVNSGAVIAMTSAPAYNPNVFENYFADDYAKSVATILNDRNHPLFNRVVGGLYSPGSTIKPLLALAGLKEGIVTAQTLVNAGGALTVRSENDPNVIYTFRDWKVHGLTDIRKAISDSVDIYFYILGGGYGDVRGLGVDRIAAYFRSFLADRALGIDLPGEANGFIPTKEWKKQTKGENWYVGDTYNISIGQGDVIVTPLWLNTYVAAIANGGTLWRPYVVAREERASGELVRETEPEVLTHVDFSQNILDIVRDGMYRTTTIGTAPMLKEVPVALAAKTGTAQVASGRALNSLFIVYGPLDKPQIAMTVLVENINQSQSLAVKVAHDFMMWYFGPHTTPNPTP